MRVERAGHGPAWWWLPVGGVLSGLAVNGRWDIAVCAWLFPVFILRFARAARTIPAVLGVTVVAMAAQLVWAVESGILLPPLLALVVSLGSLPGLAFLVDRAAVRRLLPAVGAGGAGTVPGTLRLVAASLVFPCSRVALEFAVASWSPIGSVTGQLASTQHSALALVQSAALVGTYGVTFLVAWASSSLALTWQWWDVSRAPVVRFAAFVVVTLFAVAGAGTSALQAVPGETLAQGRTPSARRTVRIAGISPSRASWDLQSSTVERYGATAGPVTSPDSVFRTGFGPAIADMLSATEREARAGARIIVWAEGSVVVRTRGRAGLVARVARIAAAHHSYVLMSVIEITDRAPYVRNTVEMIGADGRVAWTYDKTHPVPFAERARSGAGELPVLDTPYGRLSAAICFDADFPALMRQAGRQGAGIMLVPAADWQEFGGVHTEQIALTAVANGFAVVRQDVEGVSGAFDRFGRRLASADYFATDQQVMVVDLPIDGSRTLYAATGDVFGWSCLLATLALLALLARTSARANTRRRQTPSAVWAVPCQAPAPSLTIRDRREIYG